MSDSSVYKRYAKALLDSLSADAEVRAAGKELADFSSIYKTNDDLRKILIHPGVKKENKRAIVADIVAKTGYSEKVCNLLAVIVDNGRIDIIGEISNGYAHLAQQRLGEVGVLVTSAIELSDDDKKRLAEVFSAVTGKKAGIEVSVDSSLIGGVVARVGSKVYDGSIRNQLHLMRVKLEQEA